ncbi:unnamed protein product, partial [Oppiella nova]
MNPSNGSTYGTVVHGSSLPSDPFEQMVAEYSEHRNSWEVLRASTDHSCRPVADECMARPLRPEPLRPSHHMWSHCHQSMEPLTIQSINYCSHGVESAPDITLTTEADNTVKTIVEDESDTEVVVYNHIT